MRDAAKALVVRTNLEVHLNATGDLALARPAHAPSESAAQPPSARAHGDAQGHAA